jgi:hypothetical protein
VNALFTHITHHKKITVSLFLLLAIFSALLISLTTVNYDLVKYLPQDAPSTKAIAIMEEEFGNNNPNARIMLQDVTIQQTLNLKQQIAAIPGVHAVTWLDDVIGETNLTSVPLEYLDANLIENYYKDGAALLGISIANGEEASVLTALRELLGEDSAIAGSAANAASTQALAVTEVINAMAILLPVILIILLISTTSWLEPLLFLITIGIAVLLNMGSNLFFGEISFITRTVSPILQLAVSLDYAIFLLHRFTDLRKEHQPLKAMQIAMGQSFTTVAASAATTVLGFVALLFMRFGIGSDLGINLVKGVLLSFVSVMVFLPALTLLVYPILDKTKHRSFIPSFQGLSKNLLKTRYLFLVLALILVVPSFLAQSQTSFQYGMGGVTKSSRAGQDALRIDERFGHENILVLLVPKGDIGLEKELSTALQTIPHVTQVVGYVTAVGAEIPTSIAPPAVVDQFYSANYARIMLYTNTADEGETAFATVAQVHSTAAEYYPDYYITGTSATLYDMKLVVENDTTKVNMAAIIGIFLVLLIAFRSGRLPVILVFVIETAIWINLAIPYFSGQSLSFIGYLIVSTVQLGATVDYAILLTHNYREERQTLPRLAAMEKTLANNLISIFVSAGILATAGFALAVTSGNPIVSELGILLGRGTLLSFVMVILVLPALLMLLDSKKD